MRTIDADALLRELSEIIRHNTGECIYGTEMAVNAVMDAPTIGGWISVKDRLPEKSGDYIAYTKDEIVWPYFFRGTCWEDGLGYRTETVTHWMPLPEPPEEANVDE